MSKIEKLFFVDTETTDLDPARDQVIEIFGAMTELYRGRALVLETYHAKIPPAVPMGEFSAKNFAGEKWDGSVLPSVAIHGLLAFWRMHSGSTWISQNPAFDHSFLKPLARKFGAVWPGFPEVDYHTFDLASSVLPLVLNGDIKSVSLRNSREWAGCPGVQDHRARGDVADMICVHNALAAHVRGEPYSYVNPFQGSLKL